MVTEIKRYKTADGTEFAQRADADIHEAREALNQALAQRDFATSHDIIREIEASYDFEQLWSKYLSAWSVVRARNNQLRTAERLKAGGTLP